MKTLKSFRNTAWLLCVALVIGISGCGGGGGGANPADPVVVPAVVVPPVAVSPGDVPPVVNVNPPNVGPGVTPTIAFTTPAEDLYFTGPMEFAFAVTGSPDKVELYKNGALEATLQAPYAYRWENPSEAEGTYTFTAKTIKSGSTDITSAPRTIIIDRTFPTLVSRTPADGAKNVLSTDEISITMSEPMLPSSIDANSVRLYIGQTELLTTTSLDSTGKKIRVAFVRTPILPATVTMVVNGIKDLAGKVASVPNISFGMVDQIITGPPKVILTLSKYGLSNSGATTAKINLQNFSSSTPLSSTISIRLLTNGRILAVNPSSLAQGPVDCPVGTCRLETFYLNSIQNGSHPIKAQVYLADGTIIESNVVTLSVNIQNLSFNFPAGWTPFPDNIGSVLGAPAPQAFTDREASNQDKFGFPPDIQWRSHQQVFDAARNAESGIAVYNRKFNIAAIDNIVGAEGIYVFSFGFDNTAFNNDTVYARARACRFVNDCTVWNSRITTVSNSSYNKGELRLNAPRIDGTGYIEVEVTFDSRQRNSNFLVYNVDFSLYK
jgi:Bacterial Ig-like domain/Bacterial Ig domain